MAGGIFTPIIQEKVERNAAWLSIRKKTGHKVSKDSIALSFCQLSIMFSNSSGIGLGSEIGFNGLTAFAG